MIIIYFPKTLGGVSFEKAGKSIRGGKPTQSPKAVGKLLRLSQFVLKPHLSLATA